MAVASYTSAWHTFSEVTCSVPSVEQSRNLEPGPNTSWLDSCSGSREVSRAPRGPRFELYVAQTCGKQFAVGPVARARNDVGVVEV